MNISEQELKKLLKSAIIEVFEERGDLLRDIVEEAFEEMALSRAIEEGEKTELIKREQVFNILKDQA
jgi:hypothetical protein